jgi:hypothetical protein
MKQVLQLRDRRLKTLLATEERLVQRHNDYIHTIAEMARDMRGGQAIVSGPSDQDNSSNENHSDTVVLRLDEKVSEDAEEKRARGEDLKQAQVEKRERQAILDAVMTRVEEAQASVDEEERCRDKLVAAKRTFLDPWVVACLVTCFSVSLLALSLRFLANRSAWLCIC